jgi:O-antigen ligase
MFLEPPLALAAGFILYSRDRRDRLVAAATLALTLPALVLTLSRAGLLTLAVLAIVAVVTIPRVRLKIALLAGAAVAAVIVARIPFVWVRLQHQLDPKFPQNTFEGRLQIWSDTLHMLRDHPIFGAGLRAYTQVMRPYVTTDRIPELYPHNVFLAMWSELTILGLIAFVLLLGTLLWRGWRGFTAATNGLARPLLWGTATAFIAITVHGMFDTPYFKNDLAVEFWIVAALQVAAMSVFAGRATRKPTPQR